MIDRILPHRRQEHLLNKLQSCLRIRTAWHPEVADMPNLSLPFLSPLPWKLDGYLQYLLSNHQLFKPGRRHTVILWLFSKYTNVLPCYNHKTVLRGLVLIIREQRDEQKCCRLSLYCLFPLTFVWCVSCLQRFSGIPELSLSSPICFPTVFTPFLSPLSFKFFTLTFLEEYSRQPDGSCEYWARFKSILTKGNLSISDIDKNSITRTRVWHILCLLPNHRSYVGIRQLVPYVVFLLCRDTVRY